MKPEVVDKLLSACSTAMNGGGGDPPDHTMWAVREVFEALELEGIVFTQEQTERVDELNHTMEEYGE